MVLLLLLPLFLLSPLSSSADLELDYPQERSFSNSIVAPVQELHQLIIGEVQIILDDKYIISMIASIDPTKYKYHNTSNTLSRFSRAVARSTNKDGW